MNTILKLKATLRISKEASNNIDRYEICEINSLIQQNKVNIIKNDNGTLFLTDDTKTNKIIGELNIIKIK